MAVNPITWNKQDSPDVRPRKTCPTCQKTKSRDDFTKDNNRPDGLARQCRDCQRAATNARRAAHREPVKEPAPAPAPMPQPVAATEAPKRAFVQAGPYTINVAAIALIDQSTAGRISITTTAVEWNKDGYPESKTLSFPLDEAADLLDWLNGTTGNTGAKLESLAKELHTTRQQHTETAARAALAIDHVRLMFNAHKVTIADPCPCNWCKEARALLDG